jgi:hypothetical protein
VQIVSNLSLTARQYGEVVLPDASTGQGPGTPPRRGHKAVTVQGGYGVVFAVRLQVLWPIRVSRYNVNREQVTSQGTQNFIAGTGAVAVKAITNLS